MDKSGGKGFEKPGSLPSENRHRPTTWHGSPQTERRWRTNVARIGTGNDHAIPVREYVAELLPLTFEPEQP